MWSASPTPHVAIGASALAVAANAFGNLIGHWRAGTVKWPCAAIFAAAGIVGATLGSSLGKLVDRQKLLFLFALAMIAVGVAVLRRKNVVDSAEVRISPAIAARLVLIGLVVGIFSGFFGIGGGFLIVPGIIVGCGMAMINAIGSSLLSVGTLGLTTAVNYEISGLVDWKIAAQFIAGALVGGFFGMKLAVRLAAERVLAYIFAAIIFAVAIYTLMRTGVQDFFS